MRSLHFILLLGLAGLFSSCVFDDEKVGNYPLPRTYNSQQGQNRLMNEIQNPATIDDNGQLTTNDSQLPPGAVDNSNTSTPPATSPDTPKIDSTKPAATTPATSKGYMVATPVPGDPTHVISPHDGKKYRILGPNGRPLASGTVVAPNKNDPSKAFVIP